MFTYLLLITLAIFLAWWCLEAHFTRLEILRWERDMAHQLKSMEAWQTALEHLQARLTEQKDRDPYE